MWVKLKSVENLGLKCRILFTSQILQRWLCSSIYPQCYQENILVLKELGISENDKTFTKYVTKEKGLKSMVDTVKSLGFTVEDLKKNITIFGYTPRMIENRFKALEEGGIETEAITLFLVRRYKYIYMKSVFDFKNRGLINKNIDVLQKILSFSDMPPELYPSSIDESSSFKTFRIVAFKTYLEWKLDTNKEEIDRIFKSYPWLYNKSIRMMVEVYDILNNNVGLSQEKIRRNAFLLYSHPNSVRNLLESIPMIGELPIRSVLRTHPKTLMNSATNIHQILATLEEFNIPERSLNLSPYVLALSSRTVRERLEQMSADPVFQPYFHSHRICSLVLCFNRAKSRLKLLKESKWRSHSLNMIASNNKIFEASFKMGFETTKGADTVMYLHKVLAMKHKEVRELMSQHPFWNYVPLTTISSTLDFLRDAGYSHSQIVEALPILLYPKSEVARQLELLLGEGMGEVDCCRDPVTGNLQPQLVLQLVLYYLERPYHFMGNGVWALDSLPEPSPTDGLATQEHAQ